MLGVSDTLEPESVIIISALLLHIRWGIIIIIIRWGGVLGFLITSSPSLLPAYYHVDSTIVHVDVIVCL